MKLERIPGFIATIPTGHIKNPDVRNAVILFQEEAFDVLFAHFFQGRKVAVASEISDRGARRRELPALLDRMKKEVDPEVRRIIHQMIVRACESEGIEPPAIDAIAPPPELRPEIAEQFFVGISKLAAAGIEVDHHRNPAILAVSLPEVTTAFAAHKIEGSRKAELLPALREHAAFIHTGPVNCRDGKPRHCWTFVRAKLPA